MSTEPLTKAEAAWIRKVQKLLLNPPSDRLGLYTTGGAEIYVYDSSRDSELDIREIEHLDFCQAVDQIDAELGAIRSKSQIKSTAD